MHPPPKWKTPKGHDVTMRIRPDTIDWNICQSTIAEDEYHLGGLELSGLALDIGGYAGSVAVMLLLDNPGLTVVTVEPVPENVVLIRDNLALNGVQDRCVVVEGAVGSETIYFDFDGDDGTVQDFADQHRWIGNAEGHALYSAGRAHRLVVVPAYTIDDLAPVDDIALVKLDCEGGEWNFLDDSHVGRIERIVGEWHPWPDDSKDATEALMRRLGDTHDIEMLEHETFRAVRR